MTFTVEALVNFVLPYVIYTLFKQSLGDVKALMASSAPPTLWSIAEFVRRRSVDAVSMLVLAGIVLSLLAFIGGGSVKFLQLRENFVTVLIALVFLGSASINRPLIYELAKAGMRRKSQSELASFEALRENKHFRRTMMIMTLAWGFGLIAATGASCVLLFLVSIAQYLLVSPILNYGAMGVLGLWTYWYGKEARRKGDARRAAGSASNQSSATGRT